jgi:hypothetical protein
MAPLRTSIVLKIQTGDSAIAAVVVIMDILCE